MEKFKRCFIIGPMKDMARLLKLKNEVIIPLLENHNFKLITPEEGAHENIMRQVLLTLEQADILIADISGQNPNVFYELGIYHSFGKPYITVNDKSFKSKLQSTPFDIASYRYVDIDLTDVEHSKRMIGQRLDHILENIDKLDYFSNPVTDFYRSPVAEIPTAVGLSKNYTRNFLGLLIPDIFLRTEKPNGFQVDVCMEEKPGGKYRKLSNAERSAMTFEILIPTRMYMTDHSYISGIKSVKPDFPYNKAKIIKRTREFNMHIRTDEQGKLILADFPTVLSTLNDSIKERRKQHSNMIGAEEWEILEEQEMERFTKKCEIFRREKEEIFPECKGKMIVTRIDL
jgi:nucleoside 2-deoxyribosyltransferase